MMSKSILNKIFPLFGIIFAFGLVSFDSISVLSDSNMNGSFLASIDDSRYQPSSISVASLCTYFFGFNTAKAPFDQLEVRKAFIAAIDREEIIDYLGDDTAPAMTFTPPGVFGYVDGFSEGIGIPYNVNQSRQWLSDAGYPNGQGFPYTYIEFASATTYNNKMIVPQMVQTDLYKNLSIETELVVDELGEFLYRLQNDPPEVWHIYWCNEQGDAYYFLNDAIDELRFALGNWENVAYESLINQAAGTSDPDLSKSLYKQAEEILVETDAVIWPVHYSGVSLSQYDHFVFFPVVLR
jgi:oligopeptide transport system substrate-binding protein